MQLCLRGVKPMENPPADNDTSQSTTSSTAQNIDSDSEDEQFPSDTDKDILGEIVDVSGIQVSLNGKRSAAIATDGSLYVWGDNATGGLENGTSEKSSTPIKIMDNVTSVSLGDDHSAAITTDGSLYMWGDNWLGQLGYSTQEDNHTTPNTPGAHILHSPIKIMDNVACVSLGGYYYSAAITTDGSLFMWGSNNAGQLGNGEAGEVYSTTPIKIMDNVKSVSLGEHHSAAITTDGSLYMWGYGEDGELGNGEAGEEAFNTTPIKIMDKVESVSLGCYHSAAITTDGSLYMWGNNDYGQLGDGTTEDSSTPVKIMDNVASVSLGDFHSTAITTDSSLYMWGNNWNGQLGNGTTENRYSTPLKIMNSVVSVSLGGDHSAAITADGSLYTWGYNLFGQLGNGTTENSSTPIQINIPNVSTADTAQTTPDAVDTLPMTNAPEPDVEYIEPPAEDFSYEYDTELDGVVIYGYGYRSYNCGERRKQAEFIGNRNDLR